MYLIVGLGNPGLKYRNTRHNVGFSAIDCFAKEHGMRFSKKRFRGVTAEGVIGGEKIVLLKPHTYMNLSGQAVAEAAKFYQLPPEHVIVFYDDIDLDLGRLRIKGSGSAGTHNGMRSIISSLGRQDFPRIRIGIGKNPPYMDLAVYVLSKLTKDQKKLIDDACARAAEAAELIIKNGNADMAMSRFNGKG